MVIEYSFNGYNIAVELRMGLRQGPPLQFAGSGMCTASISGYNREGIAHGIINGCYDGRTLEEE
jgi:hypothetical protein